MRAEGDGQRQSYVRESARLKEGRKGEQRYQAGQGTQGHAQENPEGPGWRHNSGVRHVTELMDS